MKRIFILLGHTDPATLTGAFADHYEAGARAAGHEVRRMNIGDMHFDPILHDGYKAIQPLEPDLITFQENIKWCEHWVLVYPTWWSSMPAMLKGLFDRAWLPKFAFSFAPHGLTWRKLLKGRTARIITGANTPPLLLSFMYGPPTSVPELALMRFSGIKAKSTVFGPTERSSDTCKAGWLRKVESFGRKGI